MKPTHCLKCRLLPYKRGIEGIAGVPRSAKRLFNGSVLIEVSKRSHADNLLKASEIARCPISVYPHKSLNISKGVVRCRYLASNPEAEILSEMANIGVISVHKIKIRKNNELINSCPPHHLLLSCSCEPTIWRNFLRIIDIYKN